jgi:hypothetical protein
MWLQIPLVTLDKSLKTLVTKDNLGMTKIHMGKVSLDGMSHIHFIGHIHLYKNIRNT